MSLQIENIKQLMDGIDLTALFPELNSLLRLAAAVARTVIVLGPLMMLALGLYYLFAAPGEANYSAGYRFRWGMGSIRAWRFTQRLAGIVWSGLGLALTLVMGILLLVYARLPLDQLLWKALWCLVWQVGLMGIACLVIDGIVLLRYDLDGKRRGSWKELFGL